MFINSWMNKQNVAYPYDRVSAKEWSADRWYNVYELCKHYALWKKPDTKAHILYDSIYMEYPEEVNP